MLRDRLNGPLGARPLVDYVRRNGNDLAVAAARKALDEHARGLMSIVAAIKAGRHNIAASYRGGAQRTGDQGGTQRAPCPRCRSKARRSSVAPRVLATVLTAISAESLTTGASRVRAEIRRRLAVWQR